jgi:hypothetical protein
MRPTRPHLSDTPGAAQIEAEQVLVVLPAGDSALLVRVRIRRDLRSLGQRLAVLRVGSLTAPRCGAVSSFGGRPPLSSDFTASCSCAWAWPHTGSASWLVLVVSFRPTPGVCTKCRPFWSGTKGGDLISTLLAWR